MNIEERINKIAKLGNIPSADIKHIINHIAATVTGDDQYPDVPSEDQVLNIFLRYKKSCEDIVANFGIDYIAAVVAQKMYDDYDTEVLASLNKSP